MKRRIIRQGHSTHTITLPAKWIKKFNFKAGDEIDIDEHGKSLILNCDKAIPGGELHINVSGLGKMVRRVIASAYKAGYDSLTIHFETPDELSSIQDTVARTCIGFEILKQEKNFLEAKKISNVMYDEFDNVLRRVFLSLLSMATDSYEGVKTNNKDLLKTVTLRDDTINKFTDFCRRALNRKGFTDYKKTPMVYHIVEELEKVGDIYKHICRDLSESTTKPNKKLLEFFKDINSFLESFYNLFYKFDFKKLGDFGRVHEDLNSKSKELLDSSDEHTKKLIYRLDFIKCLIYDLNGALIAMNLK
ncbi:phosphate uptake regulator PhoU [Candidatus Woesearchaeota archaeon]|nr:phosphate uptake regulator PhoU [Candidatus Woesearchaeota archaeon]